MKVLFSRVVLLAVLVVMAAANLVAVRPAYADPSPCTGGSCESKHGNELHCPTGGSLLCQAKQCCKCKCVTNDDGTTSTVNTCEDCPAKVKKIPEENEEVHFPGTVIQ